jgi:Flp pilus assembly protein TadG
VRRLLERARAFARRANREQESGAALIEFTVVFPVQLFITLAIMQLSLIYVGHVLVQHAAFAAARAALVQDVPSGQGMNPQSAATQAAAIVLSAISPPDADMGSASGVQGNNGGTTPINHGPSNLSWQTQSGGSFSLGRMQGAFGLTTVTVDPGNVATPDVCVAEVTFQMPLVIPVVSRFFAQAGAGGQLVGAGYNYSTLAITKDGFVPRPWSKQQ